MNEENYDELTTFSGKCYSKWRVDYKIGPEEQLYSSIYRDFGSWRPVADYRTKDRIFKFASQQLFDDKAKAGIVADELVDELMKLLGTAKIGQET